MNFWQKLKKEKDEGKRGAILALAPMADVTDPAFRYVIARHGKPDVTWTEFVSADGLFLGPVREHCQKLLDGSITRETFLKELSNGMGGSSLIKDLAYSETERPIVAQFFTSRPDMMEKAGRLAVELGFDGVDINMGCPDKSVEKQGAGAGLIKTPDLAVDLIRSAQEGVRQACAERGIEPIPVSVKTRIGYNTNELETWLPILLSAKPDAITVHARTRREMSLVPARWEHVARAVEIRDELGSDTLILGNGDVMDIAHAERLAEESGADGVMLGRAIFGNPWCFNKEIQREDVAVPERLRVLVEHTKLFEQLCAHKSFAVMKKHFKAYVNGWHDAKELRMQLMECEDATEVEKTVREYLEAVDK